MEIKNSMPDYRSASECVIELSDLVLVNKKPSSYVLQQYGLSDDYEKLDALAPLWLEEMEDISEREEDFSWEQERERKTGWAYRSNEIWDRIGKNAEKALESICRESGICPPSAYLEKLNKDLNSLKDIAIFPGNIQNHITDPNYLYYLFYRYGIQKNASPSQQLKQVETAYRALDARIVRLTGREPYADKVFNSQKPKIVISDNSVFNSKIAANQERQSKGRQLRF